MNYSAELLRSVKLHLDNSGIIAYPNEFCYGLGCYYNNYYALQQLLKLKQRPWQKGMIVIAAQVEQLQRLLSVNTANIANITTYWDNASVPTTLLLPAAKQLHSTLIGKNNTIACRITDNPFARQLCSFLRCALVSTSANLAGHIPCKNTKECIEQFGRQVLVLPGTTNFASTPSAIIDWHSGNALR